MINLNLTNDLILEIFNTSKSKSEAARKLGIGTNNSGTIINKFLEYYADLVKFDLESINKLSKAKHIELYEQNPSYCLNCGKKLPYKQRKGKFCNNSCSASFNNKKHSEETKTKIAVSSSKSNKLKSTYKGDKVIKKCIYCGKEFTLLRNDKGKFSVRKTCSTECHRLLAIKKGKESYNKIKSEGRFVGWKSRKISSYPEKFFCKVLTNNNIDFQREKYIKEFKYFLDFVIVKNNKMIDLEIDGKQHKSRKEHDLIRDKNLNSLNYIVYIIEWNEIQSIEGKKLMKEKIDMFLNFYNNI